MDKLVQSIVDGMRDLKGHRIAVVDMRELEDAPCEYFVICQGDSNIQVGALERSVREYVREHEGVKPFAVDGLDNSLWVAMDYGNIIVHIFMREQRDFYDIEHLWNDAKITELPDEY
ncbi:MAG TPA: ribosome silencing factor [Bacteroidales bacterium]|nr:ribosome silencing factor [Bacteroidales bacterium]